MACGLGLFLLTLKKEPRILDIVQEALEEPLESAVQTFDWEGTPKRFNPLSVPATENACEEHKGS